MNGTLYGVGIGPGDPELITLKAVRIIEQSPVIAVPKTGESRRVALSIAEQTIPHIHEKEVLSLHFPMTKDKCMIDTNRDEIAKQIIDILKEGKDIAFLTLGDPSVYSTYWYIHQRVVKQGYQAQMIAGVPSFCAVAAKLGISLAEAEHHSRFLSLYGTNAANRRYQGYYENRSFCGTSKKASETIRLLR